MEDTGTRFRGPLARRSFVALAVLVALTGCATQVQAPATREEMIGRGAQRLQYDELEVMLPGARMTMIGSIGIQAAWTNREDGSLTAVPDRVGLAAWIGRGKWWLARNGAFCTEIEWQAGTVSQGTRRGCWHLYRLDEDYFGVPSDGRSTPVDRFTIRPVSTPRGAATSGTR